MKSHPTAVVEHTNYEDIDYTPTNVFLQWKGTKVCLDFRCECGYEGHFEGFFAYVLECEECGTLWQMPNTVYPKKITSDQFDSAGPVVPLNND